MVAAVNDDAALLALVEAAREARSRAHAPYSGYRVGAALRAHDGRVFLGVNVENSAYPTCVCAEMNALTTAVAAGADRFEALAVATDPKPGLEPGAPCGNCRQGLSEFGLDLTIILAGAEGDAFIRTSLRELLPRAFTSESLL